MNNIFDQDPFSEENNTGANWKRTNELLRSHDELFNIIKKDKILQDSFKKENNEYVVITKVKRDRRDWYYCSLVLHNKGEILDELDLIRDERRTETQPYDKNDVKWNTFVKEAARKHHHKCKKVIEKLEEKEKKPLNRLIFNILSASLFIVFTVIGCYYLYNQFLKHDPEPTERTVINREPTETVSIEDRIKPEGEVSGINDNYKEEEKITCIIRGKDDRSLKEMIFEVKNSDNDSVLKQRWEVTEKSCEKEYTFAIKEPGGYTYHLYVWDGANNRYESEGDFKIQKSGNEPDRDEILNILKGE
jgi:hypothetical protein